MRAQHGGVVAQVRLSGRGRANRSACRTSDSSLGALRDPQVTSAGSLLVSSARARIVRERRALFNLRRPTAREGRWTGKPKCAPASGLRPERSAIHGDDISGIRVASPSEKVFSF